MSRLKKSLYTHLKQIVWALFLVYLVLASAGYLFGKQAGYKEAYLACLGIAALVTIAFAWIFLLNFIWIAIEWKKEKQFHIHKK